ncbi:hypothetical protein DFS34DRAFT_385312 [Phlyctochytrium arcticum]|nr:hypothetical protein DFS34DRAFT_385312 [Phlyctochytrium arcticum]
MKPTAEITSSKRLADSSSVYGSCFGLLHQYKDFLQVFVEKHADAYSAISRVVPGSTVGQHTRHVLDHFKTLINGVWDQRHRTDTHQPRALEINYDQRVRDPAIEERAQCAIDAIDLLETVLQKLATDAVPLDSPISLLATIDAHQTSFTHLKTSIEREVWFVCHHAIHHAALQRAICIEFDIAVPQQFGVAPSTVKQHNQHVLHAESSQ